MNIKYLSKRKERLFAGFIAATIAICTLPFFIEPTDIEADVISSNAMVSDDDVNEAGYMSAKAFREAVIAACYQMDGVKYQWGGGGYNGIDCAGSVSIAYGVALGTIKINSTPGSYGNKTLSFSGGGTPDKYGFDIPGYAGIKSSFTDRLFKIRGITPSENHFSSFETNGQSGIQSDEWINIIKTYGFQPGDAIMWWNDTNDSVNAQHITIYAGIESGVPMHWTASSSAGYFCKKPLADSTQEAGKGYFSGFMGIKGTTIEDSAFVGFYLDKKDNSGIIYTGCIFSVYRDSSLMHKAGELRDDDGDGRYTDLYLLNGGKYVKQRYEMSRKNSASVSFEDSLTFKETTGPSGVILPDGTKISLKDQDGKVPGVYNYTDDNAYMVRMKLTDTDGVSGKLEYSVERVGGDELYSTTKNNYKYLDGSDEILVTNMKTDGTEGGLFNDAVSISLEKITSTAVNTTKTVFTVEDENCDVVGTYKYADGVWSWYDVYGNKWTGMNSFPLKFNEQYIVTERFEKPDPFKCVDGSTIDYPVRNDSGWSNVDDNTYKTAVATKQTDSSTVYAVTCENNIDSGKLKVVKDITDEDDSKDGFVFELWNQDKTKKAAVGVSDAEGNVYWETGSGKDLASFELPSGIYYLAEVIPDKCYSGSSAEYTYVAPDGFKDGKDGRWYKEITIENAELNEDITNDRQEGSLKITKSSDDGTIKDIKFSIFYGGKGDTPVWQDKCLASGSTDKSGVLVFNHLPVGWYRIDETVKPEYKTVWDDGSEGRSRVVRITDKDDNKTLSVKVNNKIDMSPVITTELTDKASSHEISCGSEIELTDRVSFENLLAGYEYVIEGCLVDRKDGNVLTDREGNEYTASLTFTADGSIGEITSDEKGRNVVKGYVDITFKIDAAYLFEKAFEQGEGSFSIVCFEELSYKGIKLASHTDLTDDYQTVSISPKISTTAYDSETNTSVLALSESVGIYDKVSFEGLASGEIYKVTGTLIDRSTGKPYTDTEGNTYTKEVRFVPGSSYGYVMVNFEDVKVSLDPVELVVYERLSLDSGTGVIAVHEDINDDFQTVRRPQCSTLAATKKGEKLFLENTVVTIIDHVYYENLITGHKYYAKAQLMLSDGSAVTNNGAGVVSIEVFEPAQSSGTVDVTLKFDSSGLKSGDRVVVIENIYDMSTEEEITLGIQSEDVHVLSHEDLNNMDQSLTVTNVPKTGEEDSVEMYIGLAMVVVSISLASGAVIADHRRRRIRKG